MILHLIAHLAHVFLLYTWRSSLACGVKEIFATRLAFAALKAHMATMADFNLPVAVRLKLIAGM